MPRVPGGFAASGNALSAWYTLFVRNFAGGEPNVHVSGLTSGTWATTAEAEGLALGVGAMDAVTVAVVALAAV
eukprot:CAMPEP_0184727370 /NCGR_PEP_ID=MMETSP0314-20130426/36361_1 /TAXON_ID=38298 /ORGANISM="Rhodella maculata, Strain CCMP 736" /LENGTH=72 /DNA_ID=CAMNT_0027192955 /DNA_START=31 /DNA_END=245 /DNA_ORIENTATION=-